MEKAEQHGPAFFIGERALAHERNNQLVQNVACFFGWMRSVSWSCGEMLVQCGCWFHGRASTQLPNPFVQYVHFLWRDGSELQSHAHAYFGVDNFRFGGERSLFACDANLYAGFQRKWTIGVYVAAALTEIAGAGVHARAVVLVESFRGGAEVVARTGAAIFRRQDTMAVPRPKTFIEHIWASLSKRMCQEGGLTEGGAKPARIVRLLRPV